MKLFSKSAPMKLARVFNALPLGFASPTRGQARVKLP